MARKKTLVDYPARNAIGHRPSYPRTVVKSAARAFEILELFDDLQRPATAVELYRILGYPQSSCASLLQTLVSLGYLHFDRKSHCFVPTPKVSLLGGWSNSQLFEDGRLRHAMRELSERTRETIILATRSGLQVQYIHVIQAAVYDPKRPHLTWGTFRPLARSGTGYAILSAYSNKDIRSLVGRLNHGLPDAEAANTDKLLEMVEDVRRRGYAFHPNLVVPGSAVVAVPLPVQPGHPPLALAVGGYSGALAARLEFLIDSLRDVIQNILKAAALPVVEIDVGEGKPKAARGINT